MLNSAKQSLHNDVKALSPLDDLEQAHIAETLRWIESGEPLYRIAKPATPEQHLCSYALLFDPQTAQILLADHIQAELWLPTGGHVEPGENPKDTASRECQEELGLTPKFIDPRPFFLTVTKTVGLTAGHTDVSLWYLMQGNSELLHSHDPEEFREIRWFPLDALPYPRVDPHMNRCIRKLATARATK